MKRILKWVASLALTVAVAGTTFLPAMTANAAEAEGTEKVYTTSCDMAKFIYQGYYHCDTGVNPNSNGPIAISKAKLVNKNVFGKEVTERCLCRRSCRNRVHVQRATRSHHRLTGRFRAG